MTDSNRVFFDTNPLIYYLEDEGEYGEKIAKFMDDYAYDKGTDLLSKP